MRNVVASEQLTSFETASIISVISVLIVGEKTTAEGSKLDLFEKYLKSEKCEYWDKSIYNSITKKNLKMSKNAYRGWHDRLFKHPDCNIGHDLEVILKQVATECSSDFLKLKNSIRNYLEENECAFCETLAYLCAIRSLVVLAVSYCELAQERHSKFSPCWNSLEVIKPKNFDLMLKSIYEGLSVPEDVDVNNSAKVLQATDVLAEKIYYRYDKYFNVNNH